MNKQSPWLFEAPFTSATTHYINPYSHPEMEYEAGTGWFWQALHQAVTEVKRARQYLGGNSPAAKQALAIARQRVTLAGSMVKQITSEPRSQQFLGAAHVAIQRAQSYLAANNANMAAAELKTASVALSATIRVLRTKKGAKVWN
ncbi:hypothetical protein [Nostoc sp. GT001]|uniref:hypothetical protein n=1 Tax=Nostoc sp. GT001 TaxID=3056647 RepID=UPI0025AA766F|nr:hypothetical protein [Nostoc sp. GT001]MDM9580112.1 hypothetical protein [Nostoc sp. GT001]